MYIYNLIYNVVIELFQINPGADRENTTVMAAANAAAERLPQCVIFEGLHALQLGAQNFRPVAETN